MKKGEAVPPARHTSSPESGLRTLMPRFQGELLVVVGAVCACTPTSGRFQINRLKILSRTTFSTNLTHMLSWKQVGWSTKRNSISKISSVNVPLRSRLDHHEGNVQVGSRLVRLLSGLYEINPGDAVAVASEDRRKMQLSSGTSRDEAKQQSSGTP